jgi:ubiquinone/menaquinone biosynthesis C-methylase UbiE
MDEGLGNKEQKEYFDKIAAEYEAGNLVFVEFKERLSKVVSPYIRGKVLDIGNGGMINFNVAGAKSLTLVDVAGDLLKSPKIVKDGKFVALKTRKKVEKLEASALDLPFRNAAFDTVCLFDVIHHLSVSRLDASRKNAEVAVKEAWRVLKPGGKLIVLEDCPTWPFKAILDWGYDFWYKVLWQFKKPLPYFLSEKQLLTFLMRNGFLIRDIKGLAWSKRIYLPIFPFWSPPGWLWELVLKSRLFICVKDK